MHVELGADLQLGADLHVRLRAAVLHSRSAASGGGAEAESGTDGYIPMGPRRGLSDGWSGSGQTVR